MRYEIAQLNPELDLPDRFFLLREKGEAAYTILNDVLRHAPDDEPLVVVFPPEQIMDASFADEAIIRLYEGLIAGRYGGRTLLLMGLTPDSQTNIDAAIHLRNLKLAMMCIHSDGTWQVVGQLERSLRETLDILAKHRSLTAPALSETIGSAVNTASNRLKRLFDMRLVRREEEISERGLQYVYHFWQWD